MPSELETVAGLAVCPSCLRTIVATSGALAVASDTLALTDAQVGALKTQRKAARKALGHDA